MEEVDKKEESWAYDPKLLWWMAEAVPGFRLSKLSRGWLAESLDGPNSFSIYADSPQEAILKAFYYWDERYS